MPRTVQEGLRPGLPLLEYGELVDLWQVKYGQSPILDPNAIPVHPKVFEAEVLYVPEFAARVWASVPESLRADIAAIEAVTGVPVPVKVSNWGVLETDPKKPLWDRIRQPFLGFEIEANTSERRIWVEPLREGAGFINLGLDARNHYLRSVRTYRRTIPAAKLALYTLPETEGSEEGIITWYSHNSGMASLPLTLIFRNFAIMFNNLGLQRVGPV